jgi:hypothetical protein
MVGTCSCDQSVGNGGYGCNLGASALSCDKRLFASLGGANMCCGFAVSYMLP